MMKLLLIQVPPRGTAQQSGKKVQCYEPATMKYLGYVPALTSDEVCDSMLIASQETYDCDSLIHNIPINFLEYSLLKLESNY